MIDKLGQESGAGTEPEKEELEGIGTDEDASFGEYPIDTLLIRQETRTVHDIVRRIGQHAYVMDPDFQRAYVWGEDKQSKLIESVLLRIPLPVLYLAEDRDGKMIVVDGLQRLWTFERFVNNKLKLKLKDQPELNGKYFRDLSAKLQNRIEDCNLILYVIDSKVPERARLDIFERVNSGEPLTRQQMRNSLYQGPGTQFLKRESEWPFFRKATGESLKASTMRDREFINRYCAFKLLGVEEYRGDMDDFLAKSLIHMNALDSASLADLGEALRKALENNWEVFQKHAFRKHRSANDSRSTINASLWDVMSVQLSNIPHELVRQRAEYLRIAFYRLMDNDDFVRSITYSTNDTARVKDRFAISHLMFIEVFGAHAT